MVLQVYVVPVVPVALQVNVVPVASEVAVRVSVVRVGLEAVVVPVAVEKPVVGVPVQRVHLGPEVWVSRVEAGLSEALGVLEPFRTVVEVVAVHILLP